MKSESPRIKDFRGAYQITRLLRSTLTEKSYLKDKDL